MRLQFVQAVMSRGDLCGVFIRSDLEGAARAEDMAVVPEDVIRHRLAATWPPKVHPGRSLWVTDTVSEGDMMNALAAIRRLKEGRGHEAPLLARDIGRRPSI